MPREETNGTNADLYSPDAPSEAEPACLLQRVSAPFALHRLSPWVWVERSNPHQICLYVKMQHYSLCPKEKDKAFVWGRNLTKQST